MIFDARKEDDNDGPLSISLVALFSQNVICAKDEQHCIELLPNLKKTLS